MLVGLNNLKSRIFRLYSEITNISSINCKVVQYGTLMFIVTVVILKIDYELAK